jgi:hypothetical protein
MSDAFSFNSRGIEPAKPREGGLIPQGWYRAWVIGHEMKKNKAGTGQYLELTWEIVEGPYEKRRLWERYNIDNPSEIAVKIAKEQLSAICNATGVLEFTHPGELHGEVCAIKVGVERKPGQPDRNKVYGYLNEKDPSVTFTKSPSPAVVSGAERSPALDDKDDDGLPF